MSTPTAPVETGARGPAAATFTHPDIDPRDLPALRDLARFGVMADDQIARRYSPPDLAFDRLPQLKDAGFVNRWWESLEGARVYSPTRLARLLVGSRDLRPRTTYVTHVAHDVALVDPADYLVGANPSLRWYAEDEVRGVLDAIAPAPKRQRGDIRHRPDGLLLDGDQRIAIELEHSDKYHDRYARISAWFVREWRIDRVRWYIDRPRILQHLREVNEQHGFDHDMKIELTEFPPTVRIRQRAGRFET